MNNTTGTSAPCHYPPRNSKIRFDIKRHHIVDPDKLVVLGLKLTKFVSPVTDKLMKTGFKNYLTLTLCACMCGFSHGKIHGQSLATLKKHTGAERCQNKQPLFLCGRILGSHTDGVSSHQASCMSWVANISVWAVFVFSKAKADLEKIDIQEVRIG